MDTDKENKIGDKDLFLKTKSVSVGRGENLGAKLHGTKTTMEEAGSIFKPTLVSSVTVRRGVRSQKKDTRADRQWEITRPEFSQKSGMDKNSL